jgi:hypothetical protein
MTTVQQVAVHDVAVVLEAEGGVDDGGKGMRGGGQRWRQHRMMGVAMDEVMVMDDHVNSRRLSMTTLTGGVRVRRRCVRKRMGRRRRGRGEGMMRESRWRSRGRGEGCWGRLRLHGGGVEARR